MTDNEAKQSIRSILEHIGEDPTRPGLEETPARVLAAWEEWFAGYWVDPNLLFKTFIDGNPSESSDEMVLEVNIPVYSHCEHHIAPIRGVAHVAYIPNDEIVGLSKLARVVDVFARRLQVQERLTNQIADCINENLHPQGCGVVITAEHFCMCSRGVRLPGVMTTTSALRGVFRTEPDCRDEFMTLISMTK